MGSILYIKTVIARMYICVCTCRPTYNAYIYMYIYMYIYAGLDTHDTSCASCIIGLHYNWSCHDHHHDHCAISYNNIDCLFVMYHMCVQYTYGTCIYIAPLLPVYYQFALLQYRYSTSIYTCTLYIMSN